MLARFFLALAMCAWAFHAYPQEPTNVDPEQGDPQDCVPPSTYTPHPGDPPFGVHVQTTARIKNKRYLLGVEYCEDGTFEFSGSNQGTVSLEGNLYGTGQWWWQDGKSCTQLDESDTGTEILPGECKEPGHWLGDHKVPVRSGTPPVRRRHSPQARPGEVH
jgi:hypothetical protein